MFVIALKLRKFLRGIPRYCKLLTFCYEYVKSLKKFIKDFCNNKVGGITEF